MTTNSSTSRELQAETLGPGFLHKRGRISPELNLTHQWAGISLRMPSALVVPTMGGHQAQVTAAPQPAMAKPSLLTSRLAPVLDPLVPDQVHYQANTSSERFGPLSQHLWDPVPPSSGHTQASGHPGYCSHLCQKQAPLIKVPLCLPVGPKTN